MTCFAVKAFELRSGEAVSGCSYIGDAHSEEYCPLCCKVDGLLRRLYNAHYQAQGYAVDVVLLQKIKFVSTIYDRR
jgi:hypothetical protein